MEFRWDMSGRRKDWKGNVKMRHVMGALALAAGVACAQEEVELAKQNLEKLLETKRLISQEQRDWKLGRELLTDRIGVLEKELESIQAKTAQTTNETAVLDATFAEVQAQNLQLNAASARMRAAVADLEKRLPILLARTPEPVRERVKPLAQR